MIMVELGGVGVIAVMMTMMKMIELFDRCVRYIYNFINFFSNFILLTRKYLLLRLRFFKLAGWGLGIFRIFLKLEYEGIFIYNLC